MIVPPSTLPPMPGMATPTNDNDTAAPSQTNLLMAAAEMHKMGKLSSTPRFKSPSAPTSMAKPK